MIPASAIDYTRDVPFVHGILMRMDPMYAALVVP